MNPPSRQMKARSGELTNLKLYILSLIEPKPPEGVEPHQWNLLTNISTTTFDEAVEKIIWYSQRWSVEVLHKVIKSGLKVEKCRLNTAEKLARYLAMLSIMALEDSLVN